MSEIVQVPFHGTFLHTTLDANGEPVVVIKPTIQGMGLDWSAQLKKLKTRSWATVAETATVGADGKVRDMATVDLDTWSMLLANIDENKVKLAVRPLVVRYQKESAQRLREYWTTGIAISPAVADNLPATVSGLPEDYEAALTALLDKVRREKVLEADNEKLATRAEIAERKFDEYEGGPGMTLTRFHKKHFSEVAHGKFFGHLYDADYVIDERGKTWDEQRQEYKPGPRHLEPKAKGKPFLYLHEGGIHGKKRRWRTYVRPGNPELLFKAQLIRDGLRGNRHIPGHLFAIEGDAS